MLMMQTSRGSLWTLLILMLIRALPPDARLWLRTKLAYRPDFVAAMLLLVLTALAVVYVFYQGYLDHVESTVAAYRGMMLEDKPLYPYPETFPYYGLLYGPGLAEVQMLSPTSLIGTISASKIPAVVAFALSALAGWLLLSNPWARGYLIFLLPFCERLFWNRSEPFLLLAACIALHAGTKLTSRWGFVVAIGILAGFSSALKLHGAVYVIVAAQVGRGESPISPRQWLGIFAVAGLSFSAFFIPKNVSLESFAQYMKLASNHGLSPALLAINLAYIMLLNLPILIAVREQKMQGWGRRGVVALLIADSLVALVASKRGAGLNHFIPLIPVGAALVDSILSRKKESHDSWISIVYLAVLVPGIIFVQKTEKHLVRNWNATSASAAEIVEFGHHYDRLVMGLGDLHSYNYSFLRVLLPGEQVDYPGYTDLQLSGVDDSAFADRMRRCEIRYMLMPNGSEPFSSISYYTRQSLVSDAVRKAFANYVLIDAGRYGSVYECRAES